MWVQSKSEQEDKASAKAMARRVPAYSVIPLSPLLLETRKGEKRKKTRRRKPTDQNSLFDDKVNMFMFFKWSNYILLFIYCHITNYSTI